jgi:cation diffusion facilitator CzcD-associated flavoprotein CzcO
MTTHSVDADEQNHPTASLKVIVIGAGIAGLFLGILLDKAGIPYDIYERAQEVQPLGKNKKTKNEKEA